MRAKSEQDLNDHRRQIETLQNALEREAEELRSVRRQHFEMLKVMGKDVHSADLDAQRDAIESLQENGRELRKALWGAKMEMMAPPRVTFLGMETDE
jgi:hypothetical protein